VNFLNTCVVIVPPMVTASPMRWARLPMPYMGSFVPETRPRAARRIARSEVTCGDRLDQRPDAPSPCDGVVPGADAQSQLLQSRQGNRPALFVHDGTCRAPVPIRSVEEVEEADPEGLFCLAHLPALDSAWAFRVVAEAPDLVRQRFVGLQRRRLRGRRVGETLAPCQSHKSHKSTLVVGR